MKIFRKIKNQKYIHLDLLNFKIKKWLKKMIQKMLKAQLLLSKIRKKE